MAHPGRYRRVGNCRGAARFGAPDLPDIESFTLDIQRGISEVGGYRRPARAQGRQGRFWALRITCIILSWLGTSTMAPSGVIQS
jgi:hypothetical protein